MDKLIAGWENFAPKTLQPGIIMNCLLLASYRAMSPKVSCKTQPQPLVNPSVRAPDTTG